MISRCFPPPEYDRWEGYFEPGEVLLWQGAPETGAKSVGFDWISDGWTIYQLIRDIQKEAT